MGKYGGPRLQTMPPPSAFFKWWTCLLLFLPAADGYKKMSLSRNGTLEKTVSERALSERGSPSRAGSGVVVPPPYSAGGSEAADPPLELRGSLDCWACSVLVTAQNMVIALINGLLASVVFGTILTPALTMIIFGFLCHSTVRTTRRSAFPDLFFWLTEVRQVKTKLPSQTDIESMFICYALLVYKEYVIINQDGPNEKALVCFNRKPCGLSINLRI